MNIQLLLGELARFLQASLAPPGRGRKKVPMPFTADVSKRTDGSIERVTVRYYEIAWTGICDDSGLQIEFDGATDTFPWDSLAGNLGISMDLLQRAKYEDRSSIIPFTLAEIGPWARLRCPGWFGLGLYDAVMKATETAEK